ncbi:CoA transferase [Pseudonocardia ailaonensis]|uniref:CoA transferase n=1 Tax=Pseudonocardia ailaonensis TaxID=367279 RepID=A0ABN2MI01_9PSEU
MVQESLRGIRVLDFTHVVAGPLCSMMLGDMGAEVTKVEPPGGEPGRRIGPPWQHGESVIHLSVNRNKRSIAVDLKSERGRAAVRRIAGEVDVVVESFRPGVMDSLGLGAADLRGTHPDLVYCSISAFGQVGAARRRPGVDGVMQAVTGLMSSLGEPGSGPSKVPVPIADMVTGHLATIGILGALHQVRGGGGGQHLDVSLYNATVLLQQVGFASFLASGRDADKLGSGAPYAAPNEAFPTADGHVMVAAYDPGRWSALCAVLEVSQLRTDPRFATNDARVAHRAALRAELSRCFRRRPTGEWLPLLVERDILCAEVATYSDVVASPEYRASGIETEVEHPVAGRVRIPGFALGPSHPAPRPLPPPVLGQDSVEVLTGFGFTAEERAELIGAGIVRTAARQAPERFRAEAV